MLNLAQSIEWTCDIFCKIDCKVSQFLSILPLSQYSHLPSRTTHFQQSSFSSLQPLNLFVLSHLIAMFSFCHLAKERVVAPSVFREVGTHNASVSQAKTAKLHPRPRSGVSFGSVVIVVPLKNTQAQSRVRKTTRSTQISKVQSLLLLDTLARSSGHLHAKSFQNLLDSIKCFNSLLPSVV
mgnify:CR=1 FL=1